MTGRLLYELLVIYAAMQDQVRDTCWLNETNKGTPKGHDWAIRCDVWHQAVGMMEEAFRKGLIEPFEDDD